MPVKVAARTRAKSTTTSKAPVRKAATAAPAKKATARSTTTRTTAAKKPAAPVVKNTPVKRRTTAKAAPVAESATSTLNDRRAAAAADARRKVGGLTFKQISELTGYGLGSEQFLTAVELLKGGETKLEVNHRVAAMLPDTTRNGTPKSVSNLVSGVIRRMVEQGFTVKGTWSMVKPSE